MASSENIVITRLSLYKSRKTGSSQEERRKCLLLHQKRLREEAYNEGRGIVEEINCSWQKPAAQRSKMYKKKLILSEWLLEIPNDFVNKWIMIPCPVGKRVLVLAGKGITLAYAKDGRLVSRFRSNLPGGYKKSAEPSKGSTLLDCFWCKSNRSYYILDVLAWNNQPFVNCEAEFRFYWLKSKLSEDPDMVEVSSSNTYSFHLLPSFPCDNVTLETALSTPLLSDVVIDGLLFYHSESVYTPGRTPLVGWLKPFMMCDMMQINVCKELLVERPQDYSGYQKYINDFEEERKKKNSVKQGKRVRNKQVRKMEIGEGESILQEEMDLVDAGCSSSMREESSETLMDQAEEESVDSAGASSEENVY